MSALSSLVPAALFRLAGTALSVFIGTSAAWLLYRYRFPAQRTLGPPILIPMVIPELLMGVSLLVLFVSLDLPLGSTTLIIAHTTICFPFILVGVQARLQGIDPALEEAALDLGAHSAAGLLAGYRGRRAHGLHPFLR
ncbi:MAG: ABC transporter permease [Chthoniobacterales bacterium]